LLQLPDPIMQGIDFVYSIFNGDGSQAYQCINGVRCLAQFVKNQGISNKEELVFATKTTKTKTIVKSNNLVTAITSGPIFCPKDVPLIAKSEALKYNLHLLNGEEIEVGAVSVGNPHAVVIVEDVATAPVENLGRLISNSSFFPERANVNFMQVLSLDRIKLRVYERGSGETLACGSGASASVVIGKLWGFLGSRVMVELRGGNLVIEWNESENNIAVTGLAEQVFIGEIDYEK